jgi:hypothetical protein
MEIIQQAFVIMGEKIPWCLCPLPAYAHYQPPLLVSTHPFPLLANNKIQPPMPIANHPYL